MQRKEDNYGVIANILIVVLAVFASFLMASASHPFIAGRVMKRQAESAGAASQRQPSIFYAGVTGEARSRIGFAVFGVPDSRPPEPEEPEPEPEPAGNIENFSLVGTLPSIGAWVDTGDATSLVLQGAVLDGYTLEQIEHDHAIFSRESERYPVYMLYMAKDGGSRAAQAQAVNVPGRVPEMPEMPEPAQPAVDLSGIVQATVNGEDGTITREMLNELMMNPLAEVGKMRLVPSDNGMMIMGMRSDSLFNKLGMKPRDVITSINGIAISDVGNVANVISSMLSGSRFDFEVNRGGSPVTLGYAVQ